jgi:hypothetical protein
VRFNRLTVLSLWFGRLTTLSSFERPKAERVEGDTAIPVAVKTVKAN